METASAVARELRSATFEDLPSLIGRAADDPRATVQRAVATARRRLEAERRERGRVEAMYREQGLLSDGGPCVGVDEVGRGPLAGPLVVGAVALPDEPCVWGLDDSKRLSAARREELDARIREVALAVALSEVPPAEIDRRGMAACLKDAMADAVAKTGLADRAAVVLIDGNPVHAHPKERCVVHGDARLASVAAASIVAKVHRDRIMVDLDRVYPGYGFARNKGYGSAEHIARIRESGLTPVHRASFCGRFVG